MKNLYLSALAFCAATSFLVNSEAQIKNGSSSIGTPQLAPVSPAYLQYLQKVQDGTWETVTPDGHGLGFIPDPFPPDFSNYFAKKAQDSLAKSGGTPAPMFAASYDLRTEGLLTPIKNQQTCGSCWAHASCAAIESKWLKNGWGTFDLSEQNLINCSEGDPCAGGHTGKTGAWIARGAGPVWEADDPYHNSASSCLSGFTLPGNVYDMRQIPYDVNVLKQAILDHGAVFTTMRHTAFSNPAYYNSTTKVLCYTGSEPATHAVNLVGWDDNKVTPCGTGAWICRNSWGTAWGENGYFYISYSDTKVGRDDNGYWPSAGVYNPNEKIYNYDYYGAGGYSWDGTYYGGYTGYNDGGEDYGIVKYEATSNLEINRIGTFVRAAGSTVSFEIYKYFNGTTPSGLLFSSANLTCEWPGYYSWTISPIQIAKWNHFYIKVKYNSPGQSYPIPTEYGSTGVPIETGKCWISSTGANSTWGPIGGGTSANYDLCIKAYTAPGPTTMLNCTSPVALSCGQVYDGTTVGANSNVANYNTSGYGYTGPEVVHTITITATGNITATLSNLNGQNFDVFILSSCNEQSVLAYGDLTATYSSAPAGTYYIVVDGVSYSGGNYAQGAYTLTTNYPCNGPPFANFSANTTSINQGASVNFSDLSTNSPTSWAWTFQGGTPATSTLQNPTITYNTGGIYNVTLTVTNGFGSNTKTINGYISVTSTGLAEWTLLVFLNGDNNLEDAAIRDVNEMEKLVLPNNINVVVLMDRIPGEDATNGDWTDTRLFTIKQDNDPNVMHSLDGGYYQWGEKNMGDGNVLRDFVTTGVANYPAKRYGLVIWDHGAGWKSPDTIAKGISFDDTDGHDGLFMKEIRTALSAAGTPLDLIGYDACQMGMVEVAYALKTNVTADAVMVGSQTNEPGAGWGYDLFLEQLRGNPTASPAVLGNYIVDKYQQYFIANPPVVPPHAGLSTISYAKMDSMKMLINAFVTAHAANPEWVVVDSAVSQPIAFELSGTSPKPNYLDLWL